MVLTNLLNQEAIIKLTDLAFNPIPNEPISEKKDMTVQELINELHKVDDKSLEVHIPDNTLNTSGAEMATTITDLLDGFDKKIGVIIL